MTNQSVEGFLKTIIQEHLAKATELLEKQVPKTKTDYKSTEIDHVNPVELAQFIKDNNIPDDCRFCSFDGDNGGEGVYLVWEVTVPTTDDDKLKYKRKRLTHILWPSIYKTMIENGFVRTGFNSALLKQFDDSPLYDRYVNNDIDRIVDFYAFSFKEA